MLQCKHDQGSLEIRTQKDRERLLVSIISTIRNTLDINTIKNNIVNEVGKTFEADRCFIRMFCEKTDKFLPLDKYSEYLSSSEELSIIDYPLEEELLEYFKPFHRNDESIVIPDIGSLIKNSEVDHIGPKKLFEDFNVKSNYGFSMFVDNKFVGIFILHYTQKPVILDGEDIELLKIIASQSSIAINHSELYLETKEQAKNLQKQINRENSLRLDNSIAIDKNLCTNIGLPCAMTFLVLSRKYNYFKDEEKLIDDNFIIKSIDDLRFFTYLSINDQTQAIERLAEIGLIKYRKDKKSQDKYYFKITEDKGLINYYLSNHNPIKEVEKSFSDNDGKLLYDINELYFIYSKHFSKDIIEAVSYFLKSGRPNKSYKNLKISRAYFSVICRTLSDFMTRNELDLTEIKLVIDQWFSNSNDFKIVNLNFPSKLLANRLKKILLYRLQEARILSTDLNSRIDFYSNSELISTQNVALLNNLLEEDDQAFDEE